MVVSPMAKIFIVVCSISANLVDAVRASQTNAQQLTQYQVANQEAVLRDQAGDHFKSNRDHFVPFSIHPRTLKSLARVSSIARSHSNRPVGFGSPLPTLKGTLEDNVTRSVQRLTDAKNWLRFVVVDKKEDKGIFRLYEVEQTGFKRASARAELLKQACESMERDTSHVLEKNDALKASLLGLEKKVEKYLAGVESADPLRKAYSSLMSTEHAATEAIKSELLAFVNFKVQLNKLAREDREFRESFESFRQASVALRGAYESQQNASKRALDALESLVSNAEVALNAYKSLKQASSNSKESVDELSKENDAFLESYRSALRSGD